NIKIDMYKNHVLFIQPCNMPDDCPDSILLIYLLQQVKIFSGASFESPFPRSVVDASPDQRYRASYPRKDAAKNLFW
ncbi:MAG TPA: hypothetical protein PK133_10655, partial [Ferruginibacter sp.]|nr:hypothetical protein [Ferruginibacter sp.]